MQNFDLKIADYFEDITTRKHPGFALSIIKDGKQIFSSCYGYANLEHDIKVKTDTVFYLCSLSKQFTATCLVFLLREGTISLADNLVDHFPSLPVEVYKNIKLKHLVHMSSGIREWYDMLEFSGSYADEYPWRKSLIPILKRQENLSFEPGSKYLYCNTNYVLLTLIMEKVTGKKIAEFAHEKIFQPLGMKDSFFTEDNSRIITQLASPYIKVKNKVKKAKILPPLPGAGGVYSTLHDLEKWLQVLIDESWEAEIIRILKQPVNFKNGYLHPYLMGLELGRNETGEYIQHGGAVPGYFSYIRFYPEDRLGYVWLQNSHNLKPVVINCQLHGQLQEQDFLKKSSFKVLQNRDEYNVFSGKYLNIANGKVESLQIADGKLTITNSAETFSNLEGSVFYSNKCIADMVVLEDYHDLKLIRHIQSNDDQFFLKGTSLPRPAQICEYSGTYFSSELNVKYKLINDEEELVIRPVKTFAGTRLKMISEDIFLSPQEGIKLRFERDQKDTIKGFYLDSFRSLNYQFQKI